MTVPIRVLLVEDSDDDAELIRLELEHGGFDLDWRCVETEPDFLAALDEPWDLIISDYQMPSFDGLRAFYLFQQRKLDTPFVFVSGALGEERAVEAMRVGARDFLLKGHLARLNVAVRRELTEATSRAVRRQAEADVKREQRRLAMAVEASGAGVFDYRLPAGPDAFYSERWAEILGYETRELPSYETIPAWIFEQVHPEERPGMERAYQEFVDGDTERLSVECRMRHHQGQWVDVAFYAKALVRNEHWRACHIVGVMLDLTERRRLEAQLRQAQKMDAVGRLAGGVAHDFNNLLTVIYSFGTFVMEGLREGDPAYEDMQEVLRATRRAETLTGQLLAFSRRKPVSPRIMTINQLVEEMDRMLRRVVGEDVDVSTRLQPDLWNVRIDSGSLEQVLVNLAVNSRDAMPDGGRLTIETANTELDESYGRTHGVHMPRGQYVVLAVSDTGVGMDEATQRKIFEPFFTTKEPGKGTGLGLATCYGIIKQAGGYIWVYSELGHGTTFKIYLPRVSEEAEEIGPRIPSESLRGSETVLVAEDDEQVRKIAVRGLSRHGYKVIEAANGGEALLKCERWEGAIDVLVSDVVMPEMSGKQLVERLSPLRPAMKILYMSGYTANAIVHRGVLDEGTNLVQKPFTSDQLVRAVRAVLDGE